MGKNIPPGAADFSSKPSTFAVFPFFPGLPVIVKRFIGNRLVL
ncbi:MAG: hypothetical protein ACOWYE_18000 [Desulfatiglandales bacterium]